MTSESLTAEDEVWDVVVDGKTHRVFRHRIPVDELFDLAEKSPHEWVAEAELEGGARVSLDPHDHVDLVRGRASVFHMRERHHHHHEHQRLHITVVVSSNPVMLEVDESTVLASVVAEAFERERPAGRTEDEFELKTAEGSVLDQSLTVKAAGIEDGATLFLSLKVGAAGEIAREVLVDPTVTRAKFDDEVASFRKIEDHHNRRGIWLVRAKYPKVSLVFAAPNVKPLRVLAFGATVTFENYDLWAPSVRLVDPVTDVPYKGEELQPQALLLRRQVGPPQPAGPTPPTAPELSRFMVWHQPGEVPFLCHPGVREYHEHPAHTGDDWLTHRLRGEGTLSRIVELLFQYGSSKMMGFNIVPLVSVAGP